MTSAELSQFVFTILNDFLLMVLCTAMALIMLFASVERPYKRWNRRIKAINWAFMAALYFVDLTISPADAYIRPWYRIAFFLLVLSEITYHADVIYDAAHRFRLWLNRKPNTEETNGSPNTDTGSPSSRN